MPTKTLITIALALALIWGLHFVPQLDWINGPDLLTLGRIVGYKPEPPPKPEVGKKETPTEPKTPDHVEEPPRNTTEPPSLPRTIESVKIPDIETGPATSIDDPTGQMHFFYESLARTQAKQAGSVTRVLHYGDSPITADSITADARAMLQSQYGDAGHGFVLIAKPWAWYMHRGVDISANGWRIDAASQSPRAKDNIHGLGGVSFTGGIGATTKISLPDSHHSKVDVMYYRQPNGGSFRIDAADETVATISTAAEEKSNGYSSVALPADSSYVKLTVTQGSVRLFGMTFEKPGPGVVYSSLGLNGASVQHVLRYFDPATWSEQIQHQNPDLIVINYGTNESVFPKYVETLYANELRQVLGRVRTAAPKASILVMSPMDRGERNSGVIKTLAIMPKLVERQHEIALESGCAFYDTFQAMGGAGTMARWYDNKPRLVNADYTHPLPGGAAVVGGLLDRALVEGYEKWKGHR